MDNVFFSTEPKFQNWSREDYIKAGVKYIVPMTAKAIEDEETQNILLNDPNYIVEEKFDGTRGILQFYSGYTRCFSRRESKKSGWLTENTDSVPQLRDIDIPSLHDTVIDGEMFIPNRPFRDVAAIMNCTYDKAIERQQELGWVVFHAFDILYYKGVRTERMPLVKRKEYLDRVVETINQTYAQMLSTPIFPYIREVPFYQKRVPVTVTKQLYQLLATGKDLYPTLYKEAFMGYNTKVPFPFSVSLSHKAYYEYVVMTGGEGVMLKPLDGRYYHKRGREYQKIKKFLTREVIITGFIPPTREYTGKFPSPAEWNFWESKDGKIKYDTSCTHDYVAVTENIDDCMPVTKYHYLGWIGNFEFGVTITDGEIEALPKNKKFEIRKMCLDGAYFKNVIIVGECSGFDEEMRSYASEHKDDYLGKTMEVMANEIFKDTGKLRHPRFMRMRSDKSPLQCTWADHVG